MKQQHRILRSILFSGLMTVGVWLSTSCFWALSQFADLNMEELVFQLSSPLEGTGNGMVERYIISCVIPAVVTLLICILYTAVFRKGRWFIFVSKIAAAIGAVLTIAPIVVFWNETNLGEYLKNQTETSDFIGQNYVNPKDVNITFPEEKRNLLFIYLESMEISFTDYENGGASDTNYIPELTALAQNNENFSGTSGTLNGGYSMPGTTWTIGGIFASTSGLPLMGGVDNNDMSNQESFFPNIVTLGDILEENGYNQTFMCGSDVRFGGRKLYFTEHGNYNFVDWISARLNGDLPMDYVVFWGFEDMKLIDMAKNQLTELAAQDEPFNMTMLTVDTHTPNGYTCELCEDEFGDFAYGNALACSSHQIAELLEWCEEQSWYDNTSVVIVGDHPTMATVMAEKLDEDYTRKTYTCYMNSAVEPENPDVERIYTTFDTLPTTLASLGVDIEGNRLGLGTNLFSSVQTLSEKYGYETEKAELSKQSDALDELEELDENSQILINKYAATEPTLEIDPEEYTFHFKTVDLSEDSDQIEGVTIKLQHFKNQQYHRVYLTAEPQDDGTYTVDYTNEEYFETDELQYQVYANTENGQVAIGIEGVIDPNNYDPQGLKNPVREYSENQDQQTLTEAFGDNYMVEQEITVK